MWCEGGSVVMLSVQLILKTIQRSVSCILSVCILSALFLKVRDVDRFPVCDVREIVLQC